ncbi:MAG: tetratricopeptide repeat protein [Alphaproteobacteria bacterium]|nr:tetratricopeptide repeat protein [Alphaproteobacteria bacterium]
MRLNKHFRLILGFLLFLNVASIIGILYAQYKGRVLDEANKGDADVPEVLWMTDRKIPEKVDLGAYLVAFSALQNQQWEIASDKYLQVLKTDPDNYTLGKEAYLLNVLMGRLDKIEDLAKSLNRFQQPGLLTEYVLATYAIKKQEWASFRTILERKKKHPVDDLLKPLLIAWSFAAENNVEGAYQALKTLKSKKEFIPYYAYHQGLISLWLKDEKRAHDSFTQFASDSLIVVSYLPEIQAFYAMRNAWNMDNPIYVQSQLLQAKQPATIELMRAEAVRPITPLLGIAEAFYNVSTALGGSAAAQESALLLNALSLHLRPQALLSLVWSAELLDAMGKPEIASYYYAQMKTGSQTLQFKQAINLIQKKRLTEALSILDKLKTTNQNSLSLWLILAGLYVDLNKWPQALEAYSHVISVPEFSQMPQPKQADIYFARAFIYDKLNESSVAEEDLRHALTLDPENALILNHLGYRWMEKNIDLQKGFALVKKAYKLRPLDPYIIDSMAFGYYAEGNYAKAVTLAEQSVDLMPQSSVANAHLGDIYAALGRKREAGFQYYKALKLKSDLTPDLEKELTKKVARK